MRSANHVYIWYVTAFPYGVACDSKHLVCNVFADERMNAGSESRVLFENRFEHFFFPGENHTLSSVFTLSVISVCLGFITSGASDFDGNLKGNLWLRG